MDIPRDQVLIFSSAERGYLIDAMMILRHTVDELPTELKWHWEQRQELDILLQHLMRTRGDRPEHQLLGKQVTVTLDREGVNPDGGAYGSNEIISGQLLGIGEGGNFEILEDDGMVYHCWPALEIRERDEEGDRHRQAGQG
jgi:hypothetical protein